MKQKGQRRNRLVEERKAGIGHASAAERKRQKWCEQRKTKEKMVWMEIMRQRHTDAASGWPVPGAPPAPAPFLLLLFLTFNGSVVDLQSCGHFRCTA